MVWKAGAQEITELLAKDRITGILRDPDTLADILIERGLAIPRLDGEGGRTYRYWRMAPSGMDAALYMLRLSSPELVCNGEPPAVVEGRLLDDADQWLASQGAAGEWLRDSIAANQKPPAVPVRVIDGLVFIPHPDMAQKLGKSPRESRDGLPCQVEEAGEWLSVPYAILDWYAGQNTGIARSKLIVSLHRHPHVRLEGSQVLKVRNLSD